MVCYQAVYVNYHMQPPKIPMAGELSVSVVALRNLQDRSGPCVPERCATIGFRFPLRRERPGSAFVSDGSSWGAGEQNQPSRRPLYSPDGVRKEGGEDVPTKPDCFVDIFHHPLFLLFLPHLAHSPTHLCLYFLFAPFLVFPRIKKRGPCE